MPRQYEIVVKELGKLDGLTLGFVKNALKKKIQKQEKK